MSSADAIMSIGPKAGTKRSNAALTWSQVKLPVLLILFAVLPYANTLVNGFAHDDDRQVVANPYIRNFHHLPEILGTTVWSFIGAQGVTNYYRPMMTLGYLLCYQFFGPIAYGFHLVNVLLHAGIVLLVFYLTERMFGSRHWAVVAAGIFALHPVHVESVAWIAAVTDLDLTFFFLLTFWLFLVIARPGGGRSSRIQLAMVGSFVLTILSKEQALTLPVLATIYEHAYRDDHDETTLTQKLARYGALWLVALTYILFRIRFFGALAPVVQMTKLTWPQAVFSGIALVGQYMGKLLWPAHLCAFYVFRRSVSPADLQVIAGLAALLLSLILFVVLWQRARSVSFGLLWMFVTLAPVLNARWMAANVFAERYLYLPSVGFCWVIAAGVCRVRRGFRARGSWLRWGSAVAAALLGLLAVTRIVTRNRDWHDDLTLFTQTLAAEPAAYQIRNNLGVVRWERGDVKGAERDWRAALEGNPQNAIVLNNLGLVALKQKRYVDAVAYFRRAILLKPNYTDPHLNLGDAYAEMGSGDEAALQFRAAVMLSPLNYRAHNEWGKFLLKAGQDREAEEQYRLSVESTPNSEGYDALGDIYVRSAKRDEAERAFQGALAVDLYDGHAHFNLGNLYASRGRNADAVREYQAGLALDPTNKEAIAALKKLQPEVPHAEH